MTHYTRRYAPTHADTPDEATAILREDDRHEDEQTDRRRDALTDAIDARRHAPDMPCHCRRRDCLRCAVQLVFGRRSA